MTGYLVYCPKCYGGISIWPEEDADQVVKRPLRASPNSDHVTCDVHGRMSWLELLQEYGNG